MKPMIVSPDAFLYKGDKYVWTPKRCADAWNSSYEKLKEYLALDEVTDLILMCGIPGSGKSTWLKNYFMIPASEEEANKTVFFDATFTNKKGRKPLVKIAKEFKTNISIIVFKTPLEVCMERNAARPIDRIVPSETMERMNSSLSKNPPKPEEGFDRIIETVFTPEVDGWSTKTSMIFER
jgi:predicted kinase